MKFRVTIDTDDLIHDSLVRNIDEQLKVEFASGTKEERLIINNLRAEKAWDILMRYLVDGRYLTIEFDEDEMTVVPKGK